MEIEQLTAIFYSHSNPEKRLKMENYMKNNFPFLGIQTPVRSKLQKPFLQRFKSEKKINWDWVQSLWDLKEREFQYSALDYLITKKKHLTPADLNQLKYLIITKSWWDSVDLIASHLIGFIVRNYPEVKQDVLQWSASENIWLKRTGIICQLKFKQETDTLFLSQAITKNLNSNEFFINKAIGWALREYSKCNPQWVSEFIENHPLSSLSKKEAGKYL
ncbi:DNA alkylation repair protein [Flavobacterium sp. NRK F10]|uniref:DNA alkylation repair protein n=1 Tax=Flavobacterium sp. NRK F10 TaxID=2954931 RepID=UPI002090D1F6|nr:DNA alkylation repair protein [Flavobacterium sp. NRK F10]